MSSNKLKSYAFEFIASGRKKPWSTLFGLEMPDRPRQEDGQYLAYVILRSCPDRHRIPTFPLFEEGFSSSSSSSSDEEVEILEVLFPHSSDNNRIRRKRKRKYMDLVSSTTNEDFIENFRVKRSLYLRLCDWFNASPDYLNMVGSSLISAEVHIAVFLWFAGHKGCSFKDIADRYCMGKATVNSILRRVSFFLNTLSSDIIKWPDDSEKKETSQYFASHNGFCNVIGCIDGSRINIDLPKDKENDYKDKNGNISIGIQGICNEKHKFMDVTIGHPGSYHDSRIFKESTVYPLLSELCEDYYLLGDSAYPCKKNLMTPFVDNGFLNERQVSYNKNLQSCRVCIEETFTMLKQRFPQLYHCKLRDMEFLILFINACCILHNLSDSKDLDIINKGISIQVKNYPENEFGKLDEDEEIGLGLRDVICREMVNVKPATPSKKRQRKH